MENSVMALVSDDMHNLRKGPKILKCYMSIICTPQHATAYHINNEVMKRWHELD